MSGGEDGKKDFSKELGELAVMMENLQKQNKKEKTGGAESVRITSTRAKTIENFEIFFVKHDRMRKGWLNYDEFQEMLNDFSQNKVLTREQRDRCFIYVNESESGKITLEEVCSRIGHLKESDYSPNIKPELLEMILNQPPDQETPVEDMINVGWDVIETIRDPDANPKDSFDILEERSPGMLTKVFKCREKETLKIYALKIINLEKAADQIFDFQNELAFQVSCNSPYITKYICSYLYNGEFWVVMEYMGGGNVSELMKGGPLSEAEIRVAIRNVTRGLAYLHSRDLIHRDIKSSNLMMDEHGQVKIADFKVATSMDMLHDTFAGTPLWIAPEIILGYQYDQKSDIWSLGITCYEMAKGLPPYSELSVMEALGKIPVDPPPKLEGNFSDSFKEFVALCLQKDPRERPGALELLSHPFLSTQPYEPTLVSLIAKSKTNSGAKITRFKSVRRDRSTFDIKTVDKPAETSSLKRTPSKYVANMSKKSGKGKPASRSKSKEDPTTSETTTPSALEDQAKKSSKDTLKKKKKDEKDKDKDKEKEEKKTLKKKKETS